MRTITTTIYAYDELSDEAKDHAFETWRDGVDGDPDVYWRDEMIDSLLGFAKAAGVTITDYGIGGYSYSYLTVAFADEGGTGDAGDMTGGRAMAWLENHVYGKVRVPWTTSRYHKAERVETPAGHTFTFGARRGRPGTIPSCPFTGMCYDDGLIDAVNEAVREGATLRDAWQGLADVIRRWDEDEQEYHRSRECFEDYEAREHEYDEEGDVWP